MLSQLLEIYPSEDILRLLDLAQQMITASYDGQLFSIGDVFEVQNFLDELEELITGECHESLDA